MAVHCRNGIFTYNIVFLQVASTPSVGLQSAVCQKDDSSKNTTSRNPETYQFSGTARSTGQHFRDPALARIPNNSSDEESESSEDEFGSSPVKKAFRGAGKPHASAKPLSEQHGKHFLAAASEFQKSKKTNVWGSVLTEQTLSHTVGSFSMQKKDVKMNSSDRGVEGYEYERALQDNRFAPLQSYDDILSENSESEKEEPDLSKAETFGIADRSSGRKRSAGKKRTKETAMDSDNSMDEEEMVETEKKENPQRKPDQQNRSAKQRLGKRSHQRHNRKRKSAKDRLGHALQVGMAEPLRQISDLDEPDIIVKEVMHRLREPEDKLETFGKSPAHRAHHKGLAFSKVP